MLAKCNTHRRKVCLLAFLLVALADGTGSFSNTTSKDNNYRLPTELKPVSYAVTLAPFIYSNNPDEFYFTGSVDIIVEVLNDTKMFKLHSHRLKVPSLRVQDSKGGDLNIEAVKEDVEKQWLSVTLNESLRGGEKYTIFIDRFSGTFGTRQNGIYVESYTENNYTHYLVASQLEATHAREVFPCFDEPAMKAQFEVSLVRSGAYSAVSNMPKKFSTKVSKNDWFKNSLEPKLVFRDDFERTPVISTYLLAFLVSQYNSISHRDNSGRMFVNWLRPQLIAKSNFSLLQASTLISAFENLLKVPYKMKMTNQAGVPRKGGAMENWGLIIYREDLITYDKDFDSTESLLGDVKVISHELAHQWFGNLVTMKWWNEIWLNEAFATFYSYLGINMWTSVADLDSIFMKEQVLAMDYENETKNHPIQMDVSTPEEISKLFDKIIYRKGGSVVRMVYNSIGDRVFGAGITDYIRRHSYSNAGSEGLYSSLNEQIKNSKRDIDIGLVMRSWVKQAGYPLVTCSIQNGSLLLRQHEFLSLSKSQPSNQTWIIPISTVTNLNYSEWNGSQVSHLVHWISEETNRLPINRSTDWYLINMRSTGYYRVNYDNKNWVRLTSQLIKDHSVFTPVDRARLLYDSFIFASVGILSSSVPTNIVTGYLKHERDLAPWKIFWEFKDKLQPKLPRKTLESIVQPVFKYVTRKPSELPLLHKMLLSQIFSEACTRNKFFYCIKFAISQCKMAANNKSALSIVPDIREDVLLFCLWHGGTLLSEEQLQWVKIELRRRVYWTYMYSG